MPTATLSPMSVKLPKEARDRLHTITEKELIKRNTEADAAWQHYQETGLHATGDEVIGWLKTWGKNAQPAPECHK